MSSIYQTDVLIVGGGPSGSSAALSMLKYSNLKVTIIEQNDLHAVRVGDHVHASLFDLLHYLGVEKNDFDKDVFLPGYSNLAAWGSDNLASRESIFSTQVDGYHLNREKFDLTLLKQAAQKGAVILPRAKPTDFKQTETGWIVQIKHETKGEVTIHTKYLVDASGRQSHVCRKLGVSCNKKDALVGIGSFLNFDKNTAIKQEIILESAEVGWWYAATLPDQQVVLTLFTDASTAKDMKLQKPENWFALISKTKHIIKKINKASSHESIWTRNAFSHVSDTANRRNFLAVGDAASSFDPIASMGIGFAISSACHAAKAIIENDKTNQALASYNENIKSIFKNYLETKPLFYQKEQRWKDAPFWQKRYT